MGLLIKADELPVYRAAQSGERGTGEMVVRKAYGLDGSLMVAERQPGYHTTAHRHECEQINYVLKGEIWFFVEQDAYRCQEGDFQRVPSGRIHWAWNKSDAPAVVVEMHCPPLLTRDPEKAGGALLADGEQPADNGVDNIFVRYDMRVAESKAV